MRPKRRRLISPRQELRTLALIGAITATPVLATVLLIAVSSTPSFETRTFGPDTKGDLPPALDWPTLERLYENDPSTVEEWKEPLQKPVRIAGYMIPYDERDDREGKVNRFLLVPDAGNWLHPAHRVDPDEVILAVLARQAKVTQQEHVAFWVTGRLSVKRTNNAAADAGFLLEAAQVEPFAPER